MVLIKRIDPMGTFIMKLQFLIRGVGQEARLLVNQRQLLGAGRNLMRREVWVAKRLFLKATI